ncbi:MAG: glycosyltransferase family 4 protein [Candidatus Rokubacteria bacterium]|nr:glycosyltransferase family 4 protein [Candidatus Rokubacteria bacterium]
MSRSERTVRLGAFFSHPIQYYGPLFKRLAARPEVDLRVAFCSQMGARERWDPGFGVAFKWDISLLDGYRHEFLRDPLREIPGVLDRHQFDVIWVSGCTDLWAWRLFAATWRRQRPVLLFGDSHLLDRKPWARRLLKRCLYGTLFPRLAGALYVGQANRRFFESYGIRRDRLFPAPHCVNNDFFRSRAEALRGQGDQLRERFGLPLVGAVVLFCGKLIPKKQPLALLEAYWRVRQDVSCSLLFAGEGELRGEIERRVQGAGIPDVRISGFLNQTEIPLAYAVADMLVLPSAWDETWGLVINEAMNFGLPIIATDKVGASYDLVQDGENGYVVAARDVAALTTRLGELIRDEPKRRAMGARSAELIKAWNYDAFIEGLLAGCRAVV